MTARTVAARSSLPQRVRRCLSVSVITTVISVSTLVLATAVFGLAAWAVRTQLPAPLHLGAILAGHLGGFGVLWVAQFVILDRVLFARPVSAGTMAHGEQAAQEFPVLEPLVLAEANDHELLRRDHEEPLVARTRGHDQVPRDARERGVVFELRAGVAPPAQSVA